MTRFLFSTAFLLGCLAILWVAWGFVGSDVLALTVTVVIGVVYIIGFVEQLQFRYATSTLTNSLDNIPKNINVLDEWLYKVHPSLQNAVRLRIEGEKVGLPGSVLTPYLVGLLVMLGLLGTFVGMVVTLKGAVLALEGTAELQAIRAGLAAPIEGLGLAFGTSVAGVAASAMLGLISTLNRRDRMMAVRVLDGTISSEFRNFSLVYNRQETYKALQFQAQALPSVAEKLEAMTQQLAHMSTHLGDTLLANQAQFHTSVQTVYADLAASVDKSLKESLAASGRLTGEAIKPIVEDAMVVLTTQAHNTHQQVSLAVDEQIKALSSQFVETSEAVTQAWQAGITEHQRANKTMVEGVSDSLAALNQQFDQATAAWISRQESADKGRLSVWQASAEQMQNNAASQMQASSQQLIGELKQVTEVQQGAFEALSQNMLQTASTLSREWQQARDQSVTQQEKVFTGLEHAANAIALSAKSASTQMVNEIAGLLAASEELIRARIANEEGWLNNHGERMAELTAGFDAFGHQFERATTTWLTQQEQTDKERLSAWQTRAQEMQNNAASQLQAVSQQLVSELKNVSDSQQFSLESMTENLASTAATLSRDWQIATDSSAQQQVKIFTAMEQTANNIAVNAQTSSVKMLEEIAALMSTTEEVIRSRIAAEESWLNAHGDRMSDLTSVIKEELNALRDAESQRGLAAVDRLTDLEATVATHIANLGQTLEAPMTRLFDLAAETPKAAAEVIAQLRSEISNNMARDNNLLDERARIMTELNTLLSSLEQTAVGQRDAIALLVESTTGLLTDVGGRFAEHVGSEVGKLTVIAEHFSVSSAEIASLGEAFGFSVELFSESNEKLIDNLNRIEASMDKSTLRSDEQLAYYVAQAREIIDHSMMSQKEIFEELRQLNHKEEHSPVEVS